MRVVGFEVAGFHDDFQGDCVGAVDRGGYTAGEVGAVLVGPDALAGLGVGVRPIVGRGG